jgi:hypothetical protein
VDSVTGTGGEGLAVAAAATVEKRERGDAGNEVNGRNDDAEKGLYDAVDMVREGAERERIREFMVADAENKRANHRIYRRQQMLSKMVRNVIIP